MAARVERGECLGQVRVIDRAIFRGLRRGRRDALWFAARRFILRRVVDAILPPKPGLRVLDIGLRCRVHAHRVSSPITRAWDTTVARRHRIRPRAASESSCTSALVGRRQVDRPRRRGVLLNDVIEHVPDDRAMLGEVVERMRPGSTLVITVPADMRLWRPHDERMGQYRRYDEPWRRGLSRACRSSRG